MAAARYSSNMIEMFYGPISVEENGRQNIPLRPERLWVNFERNQNNFNQLRVWIMKVPERYPYNTDLLIFAQKKKKHYFFCSLHCFQMRSHTIF